MSQVARDLTDPIDGLLSKKRYLIHDRDPLFTADFLQMLAEAGIESVRLPPRSPNANGERFVRTIKERKHRFAKQSGSLWGFITASETTRDSAIA